MPRPWTLLDRVDTPEGPLELRRSPGNDFLIVVGGRVLMNSAWSRTERTVAEVACARLTGIRAPRVLIGGLGMALTLRAALDALPADAQVTVVELNPVVEAWCRGPLSALTGHSVADPRVTLILGDVAHFIASTAASARWTAIILDLYEGPHAATHRVDDPFYGAHALALTRRALVPGGWFAVWSEEPDAAFDKRMANAGFMASPVPRPTSGPRHAVLLAQARVSPAR